MSDIQKNPLPPGIRAIAGLFALCALYLSAIGLTMLVRPGVVAMTAGTPLLFGLELAGPYMFLLTAGAAAAICWGITRRVNLARRAAVLGAIAGIVMLVPPVSAAAVMVQATSLAWNGLGIIVRVMVAWYLSQGHVVEEFKKAR